VNSRRLGLSLGINLLPTTYKLCSFNCLYCQYGWSRKSTLTLNVTDEICDLPQPQEVYTALESSLEELTRRETVVNSITISGNGEPTLHPDLGKIVQGARKLREKYLPQAKLAILSNSSTVGRREVREALEMLDLKIMKLDAGSEELLQQINGPTDHIDLRSIVAGLKELRHVTLQSLFVQGRVNNADPNNVEHWVDKVKEIQPQLVQIYTLDRVPAEKRLWKVNLPTLQWIGREVYWRAGVKAEVFSVEPHMKKNIGKAATRAN
jgi:wyosine [tRNA(Phe)-imidazoG37] synthetase (radical SAM superfamily)